MLKRVLDDTLVEESERLERCCESLSVTGKPCNEWDDINAVCEEGGRVLKRVLDDTLVEESERLERCCESSSHSQEEKSCNEYEDVDSFCT